MILSCWTMISVVWPRSALPSRNSWPIGDSGCTPASELSAGCRDGVRFLGYRVWPEHRWLDRSNVLRFRRRLRWMRREFRAGRLTAAAVTRRIRAWLGHASASRYMAFAKAAATLYIRLLGRQPNSRVLRGGSFNNNNNPQNLRSASRNRNTPDNRNNNIGFRVSSTALRC